MLKFLSQVCIPSWKRPEAPGAQPRRAARFVAAGCVLGDPSQPRHRERARTQRCAQQIQTSAEQTAPERAGRLPARSHAGLRTRCFSEDATAQREMDQVLGTSIFPRIVPRSHSVSPRLGKAPQAQPTGPELLLIVTTAERLSPPTPALGNTGDVKTQNDFSSHFKLGSHAELSPLPAWGAASPLAVPGCPRPRALQQPGTPAGRLPHFPFILDADACSIIQIHVKEPCMCVHWAPGLNTPAVHLRQYSVSQNYRYQCYCAVVTVATSSRPHSASSPAHRVPRATAEAPSPRGQLPNRGPSAHHLHRPASANQNASRQRSQH